MSQKKNYDNYAIAAMYYYAQCGCPNANVINQQKSFGNIDKRSLSDLEAVCRMLSRLKEDEDYEEMGVRCVEIVYLNNPSKLFSRGVIAERVRFAAGELFISEATVYKVLRQARRLVAIERGLRVNDTRCVPW